MNLDLRTLQLFVAVVEEQTVAKAAKREHIAASAVSKWIADLEKEVRVDLFRRQRTGLEPTPAGHPSDYFTAWYGKDGAQNYSYWTNEHFHGLARQLEREIDEGKRKAMVRQAEAILESDPPLIPIAYEKIYDAWYNKVRGQNPSTFFGIYDVVRWDTVSIAG